MLAITLVYCAACGLVSTPIDLPSKKVALLNAKIAMSWYKYVVTAKFPKFINRAAVKDAYERVDAWCSVLGYLNSGDRHLRGRVFALERLPAPYPLFGFSWP
jgi:hypothetical protein